MSDYTSSQGFELDWDSEIEKDGGDYTLLPEGDYPFTVITFERGMYDGGKKIPACKKAVLTLEVNGGGLGKTSVKNNLFLHSSVEGLLSAFFVSIGQKKKGERVTMNWGAVPGSTGWAHVGVRTYTKNDGGEGKANEIKYFIDPENVKGQAPESQPSPPQPHPTPSSGGYQPGKF